MKRSTLGILVATVVQFGAVEFVQAQEARAFAFAEVRWFMYDPYDTITARIYAQSDLIRARGDAAVDFAHARKLHAEAVDQELDNWVKHVRAYWDRKLVRLLFADEDLQLAADRFGKRVFA